MGLCRRPQSFFLRAASVLSRLSLANLSKSPTSMEGRFGNEGAGAGSVYASTSYSLQECCKSPNETCATIRWSWSALFLQEYRWLLRAHQLCLPGPCRWRYQCLYRGKKRVLVQYITETRHSRRHLWLSNSILMMIKKSAVLVHTGLV